MLVLALTPSTAVRLEAGGRAVEIGYRRIRGAGVLTVHEPETDLRVWAPIEDGRDVALIVGLHSVYVHPVDVRPGRMRLGFEADKAVTITRIENRAPISA